MWGMEVVNRSFQQTFASNPQFGTATRLRSLDISQASGYTICFLLDKPVDHAVCSPSSVFYLCKPEKPTGFAWCLPTCCSPLSESTRKSSMPRAWRRLNAHTIFSMAGVSKPWSVMHAYTLTPKTTLKEYICPCSLEFVCSIVTQKRCRGWMRLGTVTRLSACVTYHSVQPILWAPYAHECLVLLACILLSFAHSCFP